MMPTGYLFFLVLMLRSASIFVMQVRAPVVSVDRVWRISGLETGVSTQRFVLFQSPSVYIKTCLYFSKQSSFGGPLLGLVLVLLVALY